MVRARRLKTVSIKNGENRPKNNAIKSILDCGFCPRNHSGKITSLFDHVHQREHDTTADCSPIEKQGSPASVFQQANIIMKKSPHRIEMKTEVIPSKKKSRKNCRKVNMPCSEECKSGKLTDYFPVRRSERKTKTTVLEERQKNIENAVLSGKEDGLQIHTFAGKGRGVVTTRCFEKGEYVVEYAGELISLEEAKEREIQYSLDQNTGCYMYYFVYKDIQYCVDATAESERLGRLVNHSRNGNLLTKSVMIGGKPRLLLIAKDFIGIGEELSYDYGDRSKESLRYHPWLAL